MFILPNIYFTEFYSINCLYYISACAAYVTWTTYIAFLAYIAYCLHTGILPTYITIWRPFSGWFGHEHFNTSVMGLRLRLRLVSTTRIPTELILIIHNHYNQHYDHLVSILRGGSLRSRHSPSRIQHFGRELKNNIWSSKEPKRHDF